MKKYTQLLAVTFAVATIGSSALAGEYQVTTNLTNAQADAAISANLPVGPVGSVSHYDPTPPNPNDAQPFRMVSTTLNFHWVGTGEDSLNPPAIINLKQNFTAEYHLNVSASMGDSRETQMNSTATVQAYPPSVQDGRFCNNTYSVIPPYDSPTLSFTYDRGDRAGLLTDSIQINTGARASALVNKMATGQSGSSSSSITVKTTGITFTPINVGG